MIKTSRAKSKSSKCFSILTFSSNIRPVLDLCSTQQHAFQAREYTMVPSVSVSNRAHDIFNQNNQNIECTFKCDFILRHLDIQLEQLRNSIAVAEVDLFELIRILCRHQYEITQYPAHTTVQYKSMAFKYNFKWLQLCDK